MPVYGSTWLKFWGGVSLPRRTSSLVVKYLSVVHERNDVFNSSSSKRRRQRMSFTRNPCEIPDDDFTSMDRSTGSFFSTSVTGVGEGDRLRTISSPHRIARRTTSPSTLALDVSTRIACFHDDGNCKLSFSRCSGNWSALCSSKAEPKAAHRGFMPPGVQGCGNGGGSQWEPSLGAADSL